MKGHRVDWSSLLHTVVSAQRSLFKGTRLLVLGRLSRWSSSYLSHLVHLKPIGTVDKTIIRRLKYGERKADGLWSWDPRNANTEVSFLD
jgi:hypothetical protein